MLTMISNLLGNAIDSTSMPIFIFSTSLSCSSAEEEGEEVKLPQRNKAMLMDLMDLMAGTDKSKRFY